MQRFEPEVDLLAGYTKISLHREQKPRVNTPSHKSASTSASHDEKTWKCYSCNDTKHLSSSFTKPHRERGSCFKRGTMDHHIRDRLQGNSRVTVPTNTSRTTSSTVALIDPYMLPVSYEDLDKDGNVGKYIFNVIVDSGSLRKSYVSVKVVLYRIMFLYVGVDDKYNVCEINQSKLNILVTFEQTVKVSDIN